MSDVIMWVAQEGFRDEELFIPLEFFESQGMTVKVVSHESGKAYSKFGKTISVDALDMALLDSTKALLLVGGPGSMTMSDDPMLHILSKKANDMGLLVGAICFAPNILAKAGILVGRMATVWNGPGMLEKYGARYISTDVVEDGRIITANGPDAARNWAEAIARLLGCRI